MVSEKKFHASGMADRLKRTDYAAYCFVVHSCASFFAWLAKYPADIYTSSCHIFLHFKFSAILLSNSVEKLVCEVSHVSVWNYQCITGFGKMHVLLWISNKVPHVCLYVCNTSTCTKWWITFCVSLDFIECDAVVHALCTF